MTLKEAAEKWGVTPRRVNYYCAGERIPGAVKMAGVWLIPKTVEKPIDMRTKQGRKPPMTANGFFLHRLDRISIFLNHSSPTPLFTYSLAFIP